MIRLGAMAEAYDVALAPHCPLGPIALAACLQVDAICYNAFIQEQSLGMQYNTTNDLLDYMVEGNRFKYQDGQIVIPNGPGLGVEIDEEYVRTRAAVGHGNGRLPGLQGHAHFNGRTRRRMHRRVEQQGNHRLLDQP